MSSVYWLARSGIVVAGRTPRRIRHGLASTVTSASYLGWRSKRLVTQENMAKVLGLPASDRRVKRAALSSWSNYGRTAASLICLPYMDILDVDARCQDLTQGMSWRDCVRQAMAPGKGMIITTGHFGSWDLAGALVARLVPISAIADAFKDPRLNNLLQGHRQEKNVSVIPVSVAARRVMQELDASRAVAIVIDRPVTRERGVEVTFFGHRAYVPIGSAALAVKSGAAVMPGYVWYAPGNRYYIRAFPPMFPRPVSGAAERLREIQRLTQYMFACQEEVVRQSPTQWFMFRRFWPDDADPSAPGAETAEALAA
ncbi:lysophospholipid acyltransferase family protein [Dactylosporangium sp. CA-092794]|uniref:lysophospholipid acyltransferase family protein n=1 Tax=Dactylosporangium sp. CA-092794 TaxID=3239929 RepID=UPI003D923153